MTPTTHHARRMIITHATDRHGNRRVYLGGKASVECWIGPDADGTTWSFHTETAPGAYAPPDATMRAHATHILLALAAELGTPPEDLKTVPFERIAALHTANPAEYRRTAVPRSQQAQHGFMATMPNITRPSADFRGEGFARTQRRR